MKTNQEMIIEKMKQMKFLGMSQAFQDTMQAGQGTRFTPDELVAHLIEAEWDDRHNRKIERTMRSARFRYQSSIEEIIFSEERNLDRNTILRFASCDFIKKKENVLITGSTGVGKSYIATALGHQACHNGLKVMYFNTAKVFSKLKMLKADGKYLREIDKISRQDLIIFDDFGLQPMDNQNRSAFLEIIEDRHDRKSTIITSQLPVSKWYEVISEKTVADAILDRIVHTAHRIELQGESLRKRRLESKNKMEILN